jgi:hypothetical protein
LIYVSRDLTPKVHGSSLIINKKKRFVRSAAYFVSAGDEGFIGEPSAFPMKNLAEGKVGLIFPSKEM